MIEPLQGDDAFLSDVETSPADPSTLYLWWLGQSGYLLRWKNHRILIDPYLSDTLTRKYANSAKPHVRMSRRVVDPALLKQIDLVTSSHGHTDHLDPETLSGIHSANSESAPVFVAPRAIQPLVQERWGRPADALLDASESYEYLDIKITAVPASHDRPDRNERGEHPYLGYVFRVGPFTIYHSGDTVVYPGMAEVVKPFAPDIAILPINGKVGNMNGNDAARLAYDIGAKRVIPCHYDLFEFNTADPNEQFVPECVRLGQPYAVLRLGERLTLKKDGRIR